MAHKTTSPRWHAAHSRMDCGGIGLLAHNGTSFPTTSTPQYLSQKGHGYIYIYISAGPNGAHGCEALLFSPRILAISSSCSVLVSLLSRHLAISVCSSGLWFCFLGSPVLSSLFSVVLLKAVRATDASRLPPTCPQKPHSLKLSGSGPDLSDYLSSLETSLKTIQIQILIRPAQPECL